MNVAVDGHGSANFVIALQAANGDSDVVDHAESLAMIGEGVMKSAPNADADSVGERLTGGEYGSAGGEPEGIDQVS